MKRSISKSGCALPQAVVFLSAVLFGSAALAHVDDPHVCGNGVREAEELCDDGNLVETDGCLSDCTPGLCEGESYDTTFDAVRSVIFDGYSCSNAACHGSSPGTSSGGLNFQSADLYLDLVEAPSNAYPDYDRIARLDPNTSLLYLKVAARTHGEALNPNFGGGMPPLGVPALSESHLLALYRWIRNGAPETGVVEGTQHLLDACLPEPDPIMLPDSPPPPEGIGVQWRSTPMATPAQSETETCMVTYYDFTETGLVPEDAITPCPSSLATLSACLDRPLDCDPSQSDCEPEIQPGSITGFECQSDDQCDEGQACTFLRGGNNPSGMCFAYDRITVAQEALSHHFVLSVYAGRHGPDHENWGPFSLRYRDPETEDHGEPCDPTQINPDLGVKPHCSSEPVECIAGIGFGPADYANYLSFLGDDSNAPRLLITQEPYTDFQFHEGTYNTLPMAGVVVHNSHRFNLTSKDATVEAFVNLEFAFEEDRQYPVKDIFDASAVWVHNVPPYQTREYCKTYTMERGSRLFHLTSHQHRTGTLFRIWAPPNDPCRVDCSETSGIGAIFCGDPDLPLCTPREDEPIYYSTDYQDPVQLWFDDPLALDSELEEDRTFLFCGVFDNGSTAASPEVKRQSTSPLPPVVDDAAAGFIAFAGGPCSDLTVECTADPEDPSDPNLGVQCYGDDSVCVEVNGRASVCDACPVTGGLTTKDEMFILFGDYYVRQPVPEPGWMLGALAAITTLSLLRRRER